MSKAKWELPKTQEGNPFVNMDYSRESMSAKVGRRLDDARGRKKLYCLGVCHVEEVRSRRGVR